MLTARRVCSRRSIHRRRRRRLNTATRLCAGCQFQGEVRSRTHRRLFLTARRMARCPVRVPPSAGARGCVCQSRGTSGLDRYVSPHPRFFSLMHAVAARSASRLSIPALEASYRADLFGGT